MPITDLSDWVTTQSQPGYVWYLKRLSGNDTLATGSHQAGPYIEKNFLFQVLPSLADNTRQNPEVWIDAYIDSHTDSRKVRAIWYNNKLFGGTRNEARITQWGGSSSALLDPDSTGALAVFVFHTSKSDIELHVWVCNNSLEEDFIEDHIGPVEPGQSRIWTPDSVEIFKYIPPSVNCRLTRDQLPQLWLERFPTGAEIITQVTELQPLTNLNCDERLLKRRECEYELFLTVEEAYEMPRIAAGFSTVDEFVNQAQSILQRRKARSGRSLELHTKAIFLEEGLIEGESFEHGVQSEPGRRPDFLFPSQALYRDNSFPKTHLRMLAVKTTCKDRWRQIIPEAKRLDERHLLTLQEGVSESQFAEMEEEHVKLVVPKPLISKYPTSVQPKLITLESFIGDVRHLRVMR